LQAQIRTFVVCFGFGWKLIINEILTSIFRKEIDIKYVDLQPET